MKRPSNEKIGEALFKNSGLLEPAAQSLGVTRQTLWKWQKGDEELKDMIMQAREKVKDIVESQLWKKAQNGHVTTLIFLAKTLCKDRGYTEHTKEEVKQPITIQWEEIKMKKAE